MQRRIDAVAAFRQLPEAAALAAANKRIANILAQNSAPGESTTNKNLLQDQAEIALYDALERVAEPAGAAFAAGDYGACLQSLASLHDPINQFFDEVMVMAEDPALRANRLALLQNIQQWFSRVADIARLND